MPLDDINMLPKRVRTMEQMADLLQAEKQMFDRLYREIYEMFSQGSINNNVTLTKPRLEYISSLFAENPCRVDEYSECLTIHIVVLRNSGRPTSIKALIDGVDVLIPAHLRYRVILEAGIGLRITTRGRGYRYRSTWTGRPYAGTEPWRSTRGGLEHEETEIETATDANRYRVPLNGSVPWRDMRGGLDHDQLTAASAGQGWPYFSEAAGCAEAGTLPWRSVKGGQSQEEAEMDIVSDVFLYKVPSAGTLPYRNSGFEQSGEGLEIEADFQAFHYASELAGRVEAGTVPQRARSAALEDEAIQLSAEGGGYPYTVPLTGRVETGTFPERDTGGGSESGAFFTEAEAEGFHYRVPMCGTSYCKS